MGLWLAYRVQWNPWPAFGVVAVMSVLFYLPGSAREMLNRLTLAKPMTAEDWSRQEFGVADPVLERKQWEARIFKEEEKRLPINSWGIDYVTGRMNARARFNEPWKRLNDVRPYFVPDNGSDKRPDFNREFNPMDLPFWLRLALLPDLCGLNVGERRWQLESLSLDDGDPYGPAFHVVYSPLTSAPELVRWERAYPQVKALFGGMVEFSYSDRSGSVRVQRSDGTRQGQFIHWVPEDAYGLPRQEQAEGEVEPLAYEPLPFVQEQFPRGHLQDGWLYFGEQFLDKEAGGHWLKIEDMTHFLVMGVSGFGKSVFLNQILQGVRYNLHRYERVVLVDLKGGVELAEYLDYGETFTLCSEVSELMPVLEQVVTVMNERLAQMRANRQKKWTGKRFLLVIDEYAQIQLSEETTKEEKQRKQAMLQLLNRISTLGRAAGITIWAQLQKGTSDVMDSSFRGNLASQVCFKVPNKLTAAGMFGDTAELLVDPVKMPRGRFILYDADKGETHYLQARVQV